MSTIKKWFVNIKQWVDDNWTQILAQIGHFLAGYSFVLTGDHFHRIMVSLVLLETWAIPKEFWYDYKYETAEQRGSSPLDFTMYQIGMVVGLIITGALPL